MADRKVTSLTSLAAPSSDDFLLIIDDPNGTPIAKKIAVRDFTNLAFSTVSTANVEALKMVVTANNSFDGNTITAGVFTSRNSGNFSGNNQYGAQISSLITVSGANVVGGMAAAVFTVDPGESANIGNSYGIIVDAGKANGSWTRARAPIAFIAFGEDSPTTQPTTLLFDIGRPTKNVSANLTANAGCTSVIFTTTSNSANTLQVTHKLRCRVNGTNYWLLLSNSA